MVILSIVVVTKDRNTELLQKNIHCHRLSHFATFLGARLMKVNWNNKTFYRVVNQGPRGILFYLVQTEQLDSSKLKLDINVILLFGL